MKLIMCLTTVFLPHPLQSTHAIIYVLLKLLLWILLIQWGLAGLYILISGINPKM